MQFPNAVNNCAGISPRPDQLKYRFFAKNPMPGREINGKIAKVDYFSDIARIY